MNYSSRFFLYAPLALFLALASVAMGYWWMVAGDLDARLKAIKGHEAVPGVTLDWSKVTISGFSFRLDLMFDGLSVRGAGAQGPFAWHSEHFAVHALTYGALKDVFEAAGQQQVSWTDAKGTHALSFLPASLRASAVRDSRGLIRFDVDMIGAGARDFTAAHVQFHMRRNPNGKAIDLEASADDVNAPGGIGLFGPHLQILQVYASLSQAGAFAPLLRGATSLPAADAAWRQAGGAFTVSKMTVRSTNLSVSAAIPGSDAHFAALFAPLY